MHFHPFFWVFFNYLIPLYSEERTEDNLKASRSVATFLDNYLDWYRNGYSTVVQNTLVNEEEHCVYPKKIILHQMKRDEKCKCAPEKRKGRSC